MDELPLRLALLLRALVPFVFMMATVYLAAHIAFSYVISGPQSQVLAFFQVVTSPLTRPVRALLPAGATEARVRMVALVVYLVLWMATDRLAKLVGPVATG